MKIDITFHEEGTPVQTVTFKRSRHQLVRARIKYNRARRLARVSTQWDETAWLKVRMRSWRAHFAQIT
jgi:hypothetical protein